MGAAYRKEKLFGTDGIRGTPGQYPLTDGMIFKIGVSISKMINYGKAADKQAMILIGRDTRLTGERIEAILSDAAGFYGIDVSLAGVISTPGLAYLVKETGADLGVMISASHNKASDNGIKFFNSKGEKLSGDEEELIEHILFTNLIHTTNGYTPTRHGTVKPLADAQSRYLSFLLSTVEGVNLNGMRIALDCGWGAACGFAPSLYAKLGAQVSSIHDTPSGENINNGGSVDPSFLRELILQKEADIGIALDGDADRCVLVDSRGNVLDGDYILAIVARHLLSKNALPANTIATTVMANLGLKKAVKEAGGNVTITDVGDKYVLEALLKHKLAVGGEQSGHIVFLEYLASPDGLLTSLQVLKVMEETGQPLHELARCMRKFPQILINVRVKEKYPFNEMPGLVEKLQAYERALGDEGRILLRYSGTELLARVMVEGKSQRQINEIAQVLADEIRDEIGVETEDSHV